MEINRAKEIIGSEENLEVLYKGTSVWMENIKESDATAYVQVIENNENIEVPVSDLRETGRELK